MKTCRAKAYSLSLLVSLMLWSTAAGSQTAARELHWDALDVEAHLDAGGVLDVIERHTMVFTGDWNGGERVFNVRPRQRLEFVSLERVDAESGSLLPLRRASVPNNVDEFTFPDRRTLRWRSRLPSDLPFANTRLTYILHYKLSGVLLKGDTQYELDHDFAFPNRPGPIAKFTLNLDLDPAWQPPDNFRNQYSVGPLDPGRSFVLNIALSYSGSAPLAIDRGRPRGILVAAMAIFGVFALLVRGFLVRERALGRFAPVDTPGIDRAWVENNILAYPAEVVGAAWDGRVGTPEVVALIARMTAEGKLESQAEGKHSMTLRLKVDRSTLKDYERALVDGLFFGNRSETSTTEVQKHYRNSGFSPAAVIKPALNDRVRNLLPVGEARVGRLTGLALFIAGIVLLLASVYSEPAVAGGAVGVVIISLFLWAILQIPGLLFRSRMDFGLETARLFLLPGLFVALGTVAFLWFFGDSLEFELPWTMFGGLAAMSLFVSNGSINGLKSRQDREGIGFRKRLATGRNFFLKELARPQPNLHDSWYPWLLAFGLGRQIDVWSSNHSTTATSASTWGHGTGHSSSNSSSTNSAWTGGGGLSGGAGASGAWAAAAAGMAAGVAAPSSSGSGGGGSSSSGGGSSGGGGGGGW